MGMPSAATSARKPEGPAQVGDDDTAREIARQTERENPQWIVMFGTYTKEFVCFPRFPVPPGTIVVAQYPGVLPTRMRAVEHATRIKVMGGEAR